MCTDIDNEGPWCTGVENGTLDGILKTTILS
jgi:hypothetical protein